MREERARLCAAASSSPGDDLASGALISRDSVFSDAIGDFRTQSEATVARGGP